MTAKIAFGIIFIIAGAAASARDERCAGDGPAVACTEQGAIRGVADGDTLAFKGIPFAQPPVGPLRWRPTQPPMRWEGLRDGSRYAPMCPQIIGSEVKGDEDCLYLNVWRPRTAHANPLPVMVWLTGGGNHSLSGEGTASFGGVAYDGTTLVPQDVIFVSYNLRLGVLGFLAHPALDAERPERISGNYGSLDQIAMLRWLKANIAVFGGDPGRIFVFGTSAGGGNICALMTSPLTRGLIHGAAMQSSVPMGCEIQTLSDAEAGTGRKVAAATGCDRAADVAACLRGKSVKEIVSAVPGTFSVLPRLYGPNMDGSIFPQQPRKLIAEGSYPSMPVIIGNTSEETIGWANSAGEVKDESSYASAVERVFGPMARDRILAAYPAKAFATPREAFVHATTDGEFTCQSRRVARMLSKAQREPVYRYVFTHAQETDPSLRHAAHTIEHAYLFPGRGGYQETRSDRAIQRQMIGYWSRMARDGDPNGGNDPRWPVATPDNNAYLEIGTNTRSQNSDDAKCDFWDTIAFPWPHL